MAGSFLAKWRRPNNAEDPALADAFAALDRLVAERPALEQPIQWLRVLLPEMSQSCTATAPALSRETAREKLLGGVPILRGESLQFDNKAFHSRWQRAACAVQTSDDKPQARHFDFGVKNASLAPHELVDALLAGGPEFVHERARAAGWDPQRAAMLLRAALFPILVSLAARWAELLREVSWEAGHCPVCGSLPSLGEFRGLEQLRYLRCGWCASAWKGPRLFCPRCGNRDHQRLGALHREGEENQMRAVICQRCGHYVKMVATLSELPPLRVWVAELATLHLDLAVAEERNLPADTIDKQKSVGDPS